MPDIRFDFSLARREANALEETAETLKRAERELDGTISGLEAGWKGKSAALYLGKCREMKSELSDTAKAVRQAAAELRRSAEAICEAEQEAVRIAATNNGGGGSR